MRPTKWRVWFTCCAWIVTASAVTGCRDRSSGQGNNTDGSVLSDAAPVDGTVPQPDAAPVDGTTPLPDAATVDSTTPLPDAATVDSTTPLPDAATVDGTVPPADAATVDSTVPPADAATVDSTVPLPDAATVDSTVPLPDAATVDSTTPLPDAAAQPDAAVPVCGNGILESGEYCDTGISSGAGACPTSCDDGDACTRDTLVGTGCLRHCEREVITPPSFTTGFGTAAVTWAVPDVSAWSGADFYWIRKQNDSAYWTWDLVDMNGDGKPDLVWPQDPDGYYDPWDTATAPHWKVFLGTSSGFAASATVWPVPNVSAWSSADFYWIRKQNDSAYWTWDLVDMNGDGRPDLVWPQDPDGYYDPWDTGSGPFWKVFLNTGSGFASVASEWAVPDVSAWSSADFHWIRKQNDSAYWTWDLVDMNGDGRPDLVWPQDPDGYYDPWDTGSGPFWKVFLNTGSGFASVASEWAVPDVSAYSGADFYWIRKQNDSAYWTWDLVDMNGDGRPDLVWPQDPDGYYDPWDTGSGPFWKVFLNTGSGFASVTSEWAVPDVSAYSGADFYWIRKQNDSAYWTWDLVDMNGDGRPDLVWPQDPDGYYDPWGEGCSFYWKVFVNSGTGFAPGATPWEVPNISAWSGADFYWIRKQNDSAYWTWDLVDMNGDGRPDLVWPQDPDGYYDPWDTAAAPSWRVFEAP